MYKIEMTFIVPDEKLKLEKFAVLVNKNKNKNDEDCNFLSTISLAEDSETKTQNVEGVEYDRVDPCPELPNLIDGNYYKTLAEEDQDFYSFVKGEYLFEYEDYSSYGPTDEKAFMDSSNEDWNV